VFDTALKTSTSSRLIRSSSRRTASTFVASAVNAATQLLLITCAPAPPGPRVDRPVRSRSVTNPSAENNPMCPTSGAGLVPLA